MADEITLKFTRAEVDALVGACGAAGIGFVYGGTADPNDPAVSAQAKLEKAQQA